MLVLLLAAAAFAPPRAPSAPRPHLLCAAAPYMTARADGPVTTGPPAILIPWEGYARPPPQPLPKFSLRRVLMFALNPAAFLVLPAIAAALGFDVVGARFAVGAGALRLAAVFTAPLLALTLLPLDQIRGLEALREVTRASKTICLYAFGARLVPLRAFAAATTLAASAAVCEELAFRGVYVRVDERMHAVCMYMARRLGSLL